MRFLTIEECIDSSMRRNDEVSDHQRPPLADEAQPCLPTRQGNSGISLIVVNMRTSRFSYAFFSIASLILPFLDYLSYRIGIN